MDYKSAPRHPCYNTSVPPIKNLCIFQGMSNSMGMINNDPRIGSNHTEALPLVEKTIYCATVDQQDILLQVTIYRQSSIFSLLTK